MDEATRAILTDIQVRYAPMLMEKRHVVGVGIGLAQLQGRYTDEPALIVMVDKKVPESELDPQDRIPHEIEGVRVDVQEVGTFEAY